MKSGLSVGRGGYRGKVFKSGKEEVGVGWVSGQLLIHMSRNIFFLPSGKRDDITHKGV